MIEPRSLNSYTQDQMEMEALLNQPNGFERYASEKMPEFIQVVRDYRGFVRDIMPTPPVDRSELMRVNEEVFVSYSKDIDSEAFVSARNGEAPTQMIKGTTIKVPFRQIITPRITITQFDLDTEPYNLMERAQERAGQAISRIEDEMFLELADKLVEAHPDQRVESTNTAIEKADMLAIKRIFSRRDVAFSGYLMNPAVYDDFLLWGENELDPVSQRTVLETGQLPTIWNGVRMVSGILVPENKVYGIAPKELIGRMPILRDITIDVQRVPETQDKEIMAYEYVGMFIHSHKAIARLDFVNREDFSHMRNNEI